MQFCFPNIGGEIQAYIGRNLEEIATEGFLTEMESLEHVLTHRQLLPQDFSFVAADCSSIFKSMLQIVKKTFFSKNFNETTVDGQKIIFYDYSNEYTVYPLFVCCCMLLQHQYRYAADIKIAIFVKK